MPARISIEELRPVGQGSPPARSRVRRRFRGAHVLAGGARLEPRDAGGILDLALDGLLARFGPCLGVALLFWLPFGQIRELFGIAGLDVFSANLVSLSWSLVALVPQAATAAVVSSLVGDALADSGASPGQSLARGLRRMPGVLVIQLITHILALPLMFLCVAPYFLVQWLTWAAVPVYVLEEDGLFTVEERLRARREPLAYLASAPKRVGRALDRSLRLSSGAASLGRWLLLAVVGQLLFAGLLELGDTALNYPEAREFLRTELGLGGNAAQFFLAGVGALFSALGSAVRAALMTAFYLDLRVRREGLDLELALRRFERDGPPSAAGAT